MSKIPENTKIDIGEVSFLLGNTVLFKHTAPSFPVPEDEYEAIQVEIQMAFTTFLRLL